MRTHMTSADLGKMLREMRERAGLSQAALAEHLGRKQTTLSRAEISGSGLGVEQIDAWAKACNGGIVLHLGSTTAMAGSDLFDALPEAEKAVLTRIIKRIGSATAPTKPVALAQLELIAQSLEHDRAQAMVAKSVERSSVGRSSPRKDSTG